MEKVNKGGITRALTKLTANVNNIQALSDKPNEIDGLSSAELKERFDRAGATIKTYLNETLTDEIDTMFADLPDMGNYVQTTDSRLSDSRTCDNTFDSWNTARANLKVLYGTSLPESADNGTIYFLYEE